MADWKIERFVSDPVVKRSIERVIAEIAKVLAWWVNARLQRLDGASARRLAAVLPPAAAATRRLAGGGVQVDYTITIPPDSSEQVPTQPGAPSAGNLAMTAIAAVDADGLNRRLQATIAEEALAEAERTGQVASEYTFLVTRVDPPEMHAVAVPVAAARTTTATTTRTPRSHWRRPPRAKPVVVQGLGGLPCGRRPAAACTGNRTELCVYDESCGERPPFRGGLGCNAGGVGQNCRFCGFDHFLGCDFDPSNRRLPCSTSPAPVCAGPKEPCVLDRQCTELPIALQGLGCNAGGVGQDCRFCGFGIYHPCPTPVVI